MNEVRTRQKFKRFLRHFEPNIEFRHLRFVENLTRWSRPEWLVFNRKWAVHSNQWPIPLATRYSLFIRPSWTFQSFFRNFFFPWNFPTPAVVMFVKRARLNFGWLCSCYITIQVLLHKKRVRFIKGRFRRKSRREHASYVRADVSRRAQYLCVSKSNFERARISGKSYRKFRLGALRL